MLIKTLSDMMTVLIYVNNNIETVLNVLKEIKNSVNTFKLSVCIE